MRICMFCGKEISDAAVFCRHCGKSLVNIDKEEAHITFGINEYEKTINDGIKNLQTDVDSLMEEFKKTLAKNEDLTDEIAVLKKEKESLEKTVDLLPEKEKEIEKLKVELADSKQLITDLETQIADLKKAKEPLTEESPKDPIMLGNGGEEVKPIEQEVSKEPETVVEEETEPAVTDSPIRFCKYCGTKLLPDAMFCLHCGEKVR